MKEVRSQGGKAQIAVGCGAENRLLCFQGILLNVKGFTWFSEVHSRVAKSHLFLCMRSPNGPNFRLES